MKRISLLTNSSLEVNANNELSVKISNNQNNMLQKLSDGLFVDNSNSSHGEIYGFQDGEGVDGVVIGTMSPFSSTSFNHRINAPCKTHRIFTCTQTDGSDIDLRSGSNTGDYVLPGDFYRVLNGDNYDYYLILNTSGGGDGTGGSHVTESTLIASVPLSEKLNPND